MITVFSGYTLTGKTTYQNLFLKNNNNAAKMVACTTRPKRKKESHGVDYYFLSDKDFDKKSENNEIFLKREYKVIEEGIEKIWKYGVLKKNFIIDKNKNYTLILDPEGIIELIKYIGKENIKIIYFYAEEVDLYTRAGLRGDEKEEFIRRLESDKIEFKKIKNFVNLIINTSVETHEEILQKIKHLTEE